MCVGGGGKLICFLLAFFLLLFTACSSSSGGGGGGTAGVTANTNNDSTTGAIVLSLTRGTASITAAISNESTIDYYRINLSKGIYSITTSLKSLDVRCKIYDIQENLLLDSTDNSNVGEDCSFNLEVESATADYYIQVSAIGESEGQYRLTIAAVPDFTVTSFGVNPQEILPDASITLSATIKNKGTRSDAVFSYYRSTDSTIDSSDTELASSNITNLSVDSTSEQIITIQGHSLGIMYYGVCVSNAVGETITDNNCSSSIRVEAATTDINLASFSTSAPNPLGNAPFWVRVSVLNNGNRTEKFNINFYRSSDAIINSLDDVLLGTFPINSLATGAMTTINGTLSGHTETAYYGVCVETAFDINLNDNCLASDEIGFFSLVNTFNIDDNATINISVLTSMATARIEGKNFLFTSAGRPLTFSDMRTPEHGLSVFEIAETDGSLTNVYNISDNGTLLLDYPLSLRPFQIADKTFLSVLSWGDNGYSIFDVSIDGTLTNVDNFIDDTTGHTPSQLYLRDQFVESHTVQIGEKTFLFILAAASDEVSIVDISSDGTLSLVGKVNDYNNNILKINSPSGVTSAQIGDKTFLFVIGTQDHGISVFDISSDGRLTNVYNESRGAAGTPTNLVYYPYEVITTQFGNKTFLYIGVHFGIVVYEVAADGSLSYLQIIYDDNNNSTLQIQSLRRLRMAQIAEKRYLFAIGKNNNGFSIFEIGNDGRITNVENVVDNDVLNLARPESAVIAQVGNKNYLYVGGRESGEGISVFQMDGADNSTIAKAKEIRLGQNYSGNIAIVSSGYDNHYYRIYLFAGSYTISTQSSFDTYCYLYSSSDTNSAVAEDDDSGTGSNCSITHSATAGYYYIRIREANSNATGNFTLNIRRNP